jgi:GTP-binding protein EngB required for normal cell division
MTGNLENRRSVQVLPGEAVLERLAELANDFGAEHVAAAARAIAERVSEGLFYVACVGQSKRGKSTLLNALIGEAVLPTGVVPVTSVPSVVRYGGSPSARVRFEHAGWTNIAVKEVNEYVSEEKNPENARRVAGLEVFVLCPLLQTGMCLVDTPGLGSVFAGNTLATHAFVPHSDAAIVVIGADPPLSGEELQLVEAVADQVDDLLFVLNKADRAGEAARRAAVDFARRVLEKRLGCEVAAVFEVSALERLEGRGASRDWALLVQALENLVLKSGHSLVRQAVDRGIRRTSHQLLAVIKEERESLLRPFEESEQRISKLRATLGEVEGSMRDLEVLLTAEQLRLSQVLTEHRNLFLKQVRLAATKELNERLNFLTQHRNGPAYRREINHLAQEIARKQLNPWLEAEARYGDEQFRKTARRFIELGNVFLNRFGESGVAKLEEIPEHLESNEGLRARSRFHFHEIERIAAPASPLLFVADFVLDAFGFLEGIHRDAQGFLEQLLEVNSSRVQSDVEERVRESRNKLEAQIKRALGEAMTVADRALARARAMQAAGAPTVEAALARLGELQHEVIGLVT